MQSQLKFDFNNMMDFCIGNKQGVTDNDFKKIDKLIKRAQIHWDKIANNPKDRVNLGLEWLRLPFQDKNFIKSIQGIADKIASKYEDVIFLGIGGSYLGLKAAQDALATPYYNEFKSLRKKRPKVYFEGNNLDPSTISALLPNLNPKKTFVVVISKSGETTETKAVLRVVENWLKNNLGKNYTRNIFAITDPKKGMLRNIVNQAQAKDSLSYQNLPVLEGVGGRYSEFNVGLLHLAIIGVKIEEVLKGAQAMFKRCQLEDPYKNPAYMYAILHTILYKEKGKDIALMMPFSETLKSTADWYAQLLAESLGKKYSRTIKINSSGQEEWSNDLNSIINVGRTPVPCRGTNDLHSLQQNNVEGENNKVVTFMRIEKFSRDIKVPEPKDFIWNKSFSQLLTTAQEATEWALVSQERPNCTIIIPKLTPATWGELIFFLEVATGFEGELLEVNAFDQPGVESYKNYMYYKLNKPGLAANIAEDIKKCPLIKKKEYIL